MKYPELKEPCKSCLGCIRLEDIRFTGDKNCKWQKNGSREKQRHEI